jgi:hypothetical protein
MKCLNCNNFDFNDYIHGYGTCELQDRDYPASHDCNINCKDKEKQTKC